ncbi:PIR Superfamily Protein [Plasmodium ovale wallikeri]|uniref:PIR Superfamily Protein n=1 Tax=Plasmodium ovale wallikeri TaxID=864142 RepID=A0A1A9ASS3_PLAOA|nr:PIR Superfamily Protein [Plasmodium ovale wallikeri]
MLKSLFTGNFFFMNSENGARVLAEGKGKHEENRQKASEGAITRKEIAEEGESRNKKSGKEKSGGEEGDDEEDEEEEEGEEEEEEEEEEEDEEDEDEEEEDEDEKVVEDDCNKIPPELCSSNCHIHKLNSCETKDIKLLCNYLEKCSDATKKCSIESEISNSKYCETFNKIIDVYNDEKKCKDGNSNNEYCQVVKQCREKYPNKNWSKLKCTEAKSPSRSQESATESEELQVEVHEVPPPEHGTGNDSSTGELQCGSSFGLSHAEAESLEGSPNSEELVSTVIPKDGIMNEKQHGRRGAQTTQPNQVQSQTLSSSYMDESHKMVSTSLTSCPYGSNKDPCENSLQPPAVINGEKIYQLDKVIHEQTEDEVNSHRNSQGTGSISITLISASSVLGIPLLLFMLYKFTPLGSMTNKRKRKKDKWKNNEERHDRHLLHNNELRNINSNIIKYNIAYYSLVNS